MCHIGHAYQHYARITNAQRIRRNYSPPVRARRSRFPPCLLSCFLSCTHTTNAATLARFTLGRIATNAHTIRQHLQPTPGRVTLANVQTVSESTCKRELHAFPHITPINCRHAKQRAASFRRRSTQPTKREQTTNAANGSTVTGKPLHLTHSPTIRRRQASRNHCRQFRQPGPYQPPTFAPTGQPLPRFPPAIFGRSRRHSRRRSCALACIIMHVCTHFCIFAMKIIYHIRHAPANP